MLNFKKKTVKNLCLIGLMGSGKSVIGRDLSRALNINFIEVFPIKSSHKFSYL